MSRLFCFLLLPPPFLQARADGLQRENDARATELSGMRARMEAQQDEFDQTMSSAKEAMEELDGEVSLSLSLSILYSSVFPLWWREACQEKA